MIASIATDEDRDKLNHILCKVETHNHPTALSPFPASIGVGGEIRDEGTTGIGGATGSVRTPSIVAVQR